MDHIITAKYRYLLIFNGLIILYTDPVYWSSFPCAALCKTKLDSRNLTSELDRMEGYKSFYLLLYQVNEGWEEPGGGENTNNNNCRGIERGKQILY